VLACCPALRSNQWHGIVQRFSFGIGRTFVVVSSCPNLNLVFIPLNPKLSTCLFLFSVYLCMIDQHHI
jgi:hypothetical protein